MHGLQMFENLVDNMTRKSRYLASPDEVQSNALGV